MAEVIIKTKANAKRKSGMRGRKCKQGVPRAESGRISRAANAEPAADTVAKETRMRLFGVTKEQASDPAVNSVIGRLMLSGEISHEQYEALNRFICSHETYMKAIQAPDSLKVPGTGTRTSDEEADTEWRLSVERRYKEARRAIRDQQNYCRGNLYAAIDYLGFRNEHHPHMVGDLRLVGNVLHRHYGMSKAA